MRFSRRTVQQDRGATTSDDVLQLGDTALPQKAELLLGAKTRLGRRGSQQPHSREYGGEDDEYKTSRPQLQLPDIRQDSQSLLDEMLDPRGRLNVWPNLEQDKKRQEDTLSMRVYQPTGRPSINPRTISSNSGQGGQGHYDRSKEPSYVTQQTSASAVRDMGLRKPPPMTIHETSSDPNLSRRPLKSAMKKPTSPESTRKPSSSLKLKSSPSKKSKRLDLSQLFPPPRSSSRNALAAPNLMMPRAGSVGTDDSDFPSPAETVHVELRRPAQTARYETFKRPSPAPAPPARPKVFEKDIFDSAKVNVRRPPKGIQNWFDGFDISSDEEEIVPEQKVRIPGKTSQKPAPAPEPEAQIGAIDFSSPWHIKSDREQPRLDRKLSKDPVEDNLLAIHHAKERIQERMRQIDMRKGSVDSALADAATLASGVSSECPRRPGGESRLAMLDLPSQSVLSLSESDEEEHAPRNHGRLNMETLSVMSVAGSTDYNHPRQNLQRQRSFPAENPGRASTSTVQTMQTSGSIPIRLTASIPLPAMPTVTQSPPQAQSNQSRRSTQTSLLSPTTQALRQLTGQDVPSRSKRTTKISHHDFETFNSGESISSVPTDGSHLMAVSEEEMILLELMRNKRAAMQQNSFTEGYQLALKREQDALLRRRESAQQTALKILQQREEKTKSRPVSKIVNTGHSAEPAADYELRRRLSAIRKEDVDKALKMNKFLADVSSPTVDHFPEPPSRGQTPAVDSKRPPQKFELLMPSVYSPTPSKALDAYSPVSAEDSSPAPEFDDIEDHHESLRQFLASSSASESLFGNAGAFPTPPSRSRNPSRRDYRVSAVWSPSPVAEEDAVEEEEQHDQYASSHEHKERRNSINGRRLSRQYETPLETDTEPEVPKAMRHKSAMPEPLRHGGQTAHSPYHLHPNFDFTPLEFSPSQLTASPATSTSPWTPEAMNFPAPASDKPTIEGAYSSDNASLRNRAYTPDTDLTSLSASGQTTTPASSRKYGMASRKAPPRLDKIVGHGMRGPESASITSAGEDVLAAWAELGGGTEALVSRRRMR